MHMYKHSFIFILLLSFISLFIFPGCVFDSIFKGESDYPNTDDGIGTLVGYVSIPDAGLGKISAKSISFRAQKNAYVYMVNSDVSWLDFLDYRSKYQKSAVTDSAGKYEFRELSKAHFFKIIVDLDNDGKPEGIEENAIIGEVRQTFIKQMNSTGTSIFSVRNDKTEYSKGEPLMITVSGYTTSAQDVLVKVWNEKDCEEPYWTSSSVSLNGSFSYTFSTTIPMDWPTTDSIRGGDYKSYVCIGTNILDSDPFTILGDDSGDTTAPKNGTISINGTDEWTNDPSVDLTLAVTDGVDMMISNYSDFSNATWEAYATTRAWTLNTNDGIKTVYVKFRDAVQNVSETFSDTIGLDRTPPVAEWTIQSPLAMPGSIQKIDEAKVNTDLDYVYQESVTPGDWICVSRNVLYVWDAGSSSDAGSGIALYNFTYNDGVPQTRSSGNATQNVTIVLDQQIQVTLTVTDKVGNSSTRTKTVEVCLNKPDALAAITAFETPFYAGLAANNPQSIDVCTGTFDIYDSATGKPHWEYWTGADIDDFTDLEVHNLYAHFISLSGRLFAIRCTYTTKLNKILQWNRNLNVLHGW